MSREAEQPVVLLHLQAGHSSQACADHLGKLGGGQFERALYGVPIGALTSKEKNGDQIADKLARIKRWIQGVALPMRLGVDRLAAVRPTESGAQYGRLAPYAAARRRR